MTKGKVVFDDRDASVRGYPRENVAKAASPEHPDELRDRVKDAIASSVTETYDCTRVWSAWGHGTMREDDFRNLSEDDDRIGEIADAVLSVVPVSDDADEILRLRKELSLAQEDAIKFYLRCDRAARHFQDGRPEAAEKEIMGRPGEGELVKRIAAAMASLDPAATS